MTNSWAPNLIFEKLKPVSSHFVSGALSIRGRLLSKDAHNFDKCLRQNDIDTGDCLRSCMFTVV